MPHGDRLRADLDGGDAGDLHRLGAGERAALDVRAGPRLADRRVRDAPGLDRRAQAARLPRAAPDGRTVEIQRLIGRSLRGVIDFEALGERTVYLDCDVLQADGGTRCASITGGMVALRLACARLIAEGMLERSPLTGAVAAVSCGIVDGIPLLDLDYAEDSTAEVDANVVMTGDGRPGRGAGHGGAHAALPRPSRRSARAGRGAGSTSAARAAGRDRRRAPPESMPLPPTLLLATRNAHKLRGVRRGCSRRPGSASSRCRTAVELPPETGETFADNALPKARAAAAATGRAAIADDSGIEADGAGRGARRALGPLRGRAGDRRGEPRSCSSARRRRAAACAMSARSPSSIPCGRGARVLRRVLAARWPPSAAASGGFGYDPVFVPDGVRRAHDGPARRRREGRDQPPRPRPPRASLAWLAGSRADERHLADAASPAQAAPAAAVGRLQHDADPAQGGRRHAHRLGRDPHRGGALEHRPGRIDRRASSRSARPTSRPTRATPTATRRSRTSRRRSRGSLILVGSAAIALEAIRHLIDHGQVHTIGVGIAVIAVSLVINVVVSGGCGAARARTDSVALAGDAAHLRDRRADLGGGARGAACWSI